MYLGISKDDGDKILTEFLVESSKQNGTKRCSEESFRILENFQDSHLVIQAIVTKSMSEQGTYSSTRYYL
jgi:hypothetical protein